jgi:DNA invertase Pin-like site-specific DNA recombinase
LAVVYVRQSTPKQVEEHTGSTAHQRNQKEYALRWGWREADIEVIDEDLGMSGTSGDRRKGWQRLLKLVSEGRVGIIFASDISRLSRSRRLFATLVDLCREFDVLLVVDGTIVNFDDPTDRFMANIRADVAEYDNDVRKNTLMKAKLAKARQGHAVSPRPTGYVVSEKGKWVKDPDLSVRQAIEEVFKQYDLLGTVGKVLKFFADHRLQLPVRRSAGALHWGRPARGRIHHILRNPAFAGYYVFGYRPLEKGPPKGRRRGTDWTGSITIPDHHEAYLPPAEWHRIYERLRGNRVSVRQPAGPGPALCQGLVRCGRCERPMSTTYSRCSRQVRIRYACNQARFQYGEPNCWSVNGRPLEEVVVAELFRGLTPPSLEAVIAAADEVNAGYEAVRRQRQADLDRVRYGADLAERRFKQVDPANRLVAAGLERDLELALEKVREVEGQQADTPLAPPLEVTPESLDAIRSAAADLPGLWAAPSTTDQDRKLVVRLLVREVRVVAVSKADFEVEIAWVGGAVTRHTVYTPWAGAVFGPELAAKGLSKDEIAAELNRLGLRTMVRKAPYTRSSVEALLQSAAHKAGTTRPPWRVSCETLRAPLTELVQAGWSDAAIAAEFNRRGLRSCVRRRPWNGDLIMHLRHVLGIPSVRNPRVRLPKAPHSSEAEGYTS